MDATCTIQDSIHVFSLVHKYVSRILGTYHGPLQGFIFLPETNDLPSSHTHGMETTAYKPVG